MYISKHKTQKITTSIIQIAPTSKQKCVFSNKFIYFLAALGLCCCVRAFSSCGECSLLSVAVHRLLIVAASLVAEHGI